MSDLKAPLESYAAVQIWFDGLREQSAIDPTADRSRLELLQEFCRFVALDPDQLVKACLLEKDGRETRISVKGRRRVAEKIAEFQALGEGLDARRRGHRGNTIRSFLIHNGILLQSGMQV